MTKYDTLVLALGNPWRGDDGIGNAVLDALTEQKLPNTVTLLDGGTPGLETALILEDYRRTIIVDAADMNLAPGTWRRFDHTSVRSTIKTTMGGTLHDAGLYEALNLADALGMLPHEIVIYGIQPVNLDWGIGLSPILAEAIPAIVNTIVMELNEKKGIKPCLRARF